MKKRIVVAVILAIFLAASAYAQTLLLFAVAIAGTAQDVQAAIDKGADVNARDRSSGLPPLILAAEANENPEVIATLLKAGADIEARDLKYGGTVLMWAAYANKHPEVIITLLQSGADATAKDNGGATVLDYAHNNLSLKGTDALKQLEEASR